MRENRQPLSVKLFIGMLSPEPALFITCTEILTHEYGPIELESEVVSWINTDYYRKEMGGNILRKFVFFTQVMDPGKLPSVKHFTIDIEGRFAKHEGNFLRRRINIDPGYVTEAKVVLATTKDYAHRLYIGDNLYGEVTLRYSTKARSFMPHEFTYPDFRTEYYLALFNKARKNLHTLLHNNTRQSTVS
jgi:hypothetical protein